MTSTPRSSIFKVKLESINPANNYLCKVNNTSSWKWCEICSKLTIKTSLWTRNFEHEFACWVLTLWSTSLIRPKITGPNLLTIVFKISLLSPKTIMPSNSGKSLFLFFVLTEVLHEFGDKGPSPNFASNIQRI